MTSELNSQPAILGGPPVRNQAPPAWPIDDDDVRCVIEQLSRTGDWGRYHGPNCPELCRQLATFHNVEHVHLCSSGTSAVELALRGLGIGSGDEVVMAAYDFKANFQNILCVGATPVLVDLHPVDWQIDPNLIEQSLSSRTRAILISHLHGGIVAMEEVRRIADAHKIPIIEDACQNPGGLIHGRRAGTMGDVGILSFGGSKLLTAGRGGAILTNRSEIAERIKRYVHRGNDAYPISEFQAAVVIPQLKRLDDRNSCRRSAVEKLIEQLGDISGLTALQAPSDEFEPVYYKLGLKYQSDQFAGLSRDQFAEAVRAEGVAIDAGFRGLHLIHASRRFRAPSELTEATRADGGILVLHHPILLEGQEGIEHVVVAIKKIREHSELLAQTLPSDCR